MACRPYTAPIIASAMYGSADSPVATVMMRYSMYTAVAGRMMVPSRSMKTMKRIEKRQKPHSPFMRTSSTRLCTVELIQRRRCERSMRKVCGTSWSAASR